MKIYFQNGNGKIDSHNLDYIEVAGNPTINKNGVQNQVVLSTYTLDMATMMSNKEINHLAYLVENEALMYLASSDVGHLGGDSGFVPVLSVNIIDGLDCFKLGAALIVFQLAVF